MFFSSFICSQQGKVLFWDVSLSKVCWYVFECFSCFGMGSYSLLSNHLVTTQWAINDWMWHWLLLTVPNPMTPGVSCSLESELYNLAELWVQNGLVQPLCCPTLVLLLVSELLLSLLPSLPPFPVCTVTNPKLISVVAFWWVFCLFFVVCLFSLLCAAIISSLHCVHYMGKIFCYVRIGYICEYVVLNKCFSIVFVYKNLDSWVSGI